ncbi:hypothetical protein [Nocardia wallacei]|uniref:hypothetical protein n=1 Tax=Nocardia wallacei TaxID=480035 RepID=UPI00245430CE|nr:hypothetical protein [Nocardia wallacei]
MNAAIGSENRRLIETIRYQPGDDWLTRLAKTVKASYALTVVVLDEAHCAGEEAAVTALGVTIATPSRTITYLSLRPGLFK